MAHANFGPNFVVMMLGAFIGFAALAVPLRPGFDPISGQPVETFELTGIFHQELPATALLVEQAQVICQAFYLGLLTFIQIGFQAAKERQVIETTGRQGEHQEGGKENDKEFVADAHGVKSSVRDPSVARSRAVAAGLHNVFTMAVPEA